MDPIAYNMINPAEAIMNGLKIGSGITKIQQEQQAQQAAQQMALQQQTDLRALWANPNAGHADYAAVMTKYPTLAENIGKAYKVMDEGRQRTSLEFGSRVYGALLSNPDMAVEMLRERSKVDPAQSQHLETIAKLAEAGPQGLRSAQMMMATGLAGMLGPDKFAESFAKLGGEQRANDKHPAEVKKAVGDADKAVADASAAESTAVVKAEEAKVAPQAVLLDLQKKGWDIRKIQEDIEISKQANRIAAMNAATSREGNELKREELKLKVEEAKTKLGDAVREKAATVESARTSMDNLLNTADRFLAVAVDPKTGKPTSTLRAATGPLDSRLPTAQQDVADLEALVEALGSQAFMAQVPNMKGMGALSNAEGEKLQASLQNLKLSQSADQLVANVKEAQRLIMKGRKALVTRYGVPDTVPDTPAAATAAGPNDIDALVKQYTTPARRTPGVN
jgi:hypothetical protein